MIAGLPPEATQGAIFKIIFFHVPVAITAMLLLVRGADRAASCS